MEYSPLAWSSCPPSYLGLLDRVQARAQRLARLKAPEAAAQIIQPLQQRRDVAGMCVMYKAHRMQLLQLAELRLNPRARPSHSTRAAHNIDHQVTVPFARTEHYLRSFLPRYGRLWNTLVRQTDLHLTTSMHAFKSGLLRRCTFNHLPDNYEEGLWGETRTCCLYTTTPTPAHMITGRRTLQCLLQQ
ncbi:hypothetical protein GWK47_007700 [Chionoecetes opilio]|uniref:Uncharacterized protein n=1 Tax=Chionoecetes opilio TaxID=41210 RepID=A0A8J4Y1E0_CHIOP|nr:hypothetical protein GWK47_007700 [Chionoecetes opilio]